MAFYLFLAKRLRSHCEFVIGSSLNLWAKIKWDRKSKGETKRRMFKENQRFLPETLTQMRKPENNAKIPKERFRYIQN
jgi:hypothetical protein